MIKNKRFITLLAIILMCTILLSGCLEMRDFAIDQPTTPQPTEAHESEQPEADELPTLPPKQTPLIPLDVIMGYVEYTPPQLSSDGTQILYRHSTQFKDTYIVENWKTGEQSDIPWPDEVNGNPYATWAPDSQTVLFFVDDMGDENNGLYTANIKTGETKTILKGGENDCYYIADDPENEKQIYMGIFNFDTSLYDLYLLNYETGKKKLIMQNPGDITNYIFDHNGNLRLVGRTDDAARNNVWLKKDINNQNKKFVQSEWEQIFAWEYEDTKTSGAFGFMHDDIRVKYLDSSSSNTSTLRTYNVNTGETVDIYNHPDYEIEGMWTDIEMDEVVAVSVYSQNYEWEILDESFQQDYDTLAAVEQGIFDVFDSSEKDEYWLVAYPSDTKQTDYYVYDMETNETTFLYNAQPALVEYDFAPMEPISYTTDDGLTIEGYATFPVDSDKKDLPTVVLVHGGPNSRDFWGYDQEVQFLANRGYLVLQVNFRGSTGYGKDFVLAGNKEWGGLMHQDILDAVDYAVSQGWTDEERVGVYGASYGGYEALICAAFSSDVFQCAVDAFGPTSLLTFVESIPAQWSLAYEDLVRSVGDPETESDFMRSISPLYLADDMKIPLLIAQGENDVRVVQQESDQMVAALEKADVPVQYMLFENMGHGFNSDASRQSFYTAMEKFFAEHLGGRDE